MVDPNRLVGWLRPSHHILSGFFPMYTHTHCSCWNMIRNKIMEISWKSLSSICPWWFALFGGSGVHMDVSLIFSYPTPQMKVALARKADRKFRWANWREVYVPYPSITRKWACGWGVGASLPVVHPPSGRCRTSSKRCRPQRIVTTFLINPEPANRISVGLFLMRQVWRTCRERNYKTLLYAFLGKIITVNGDKGLISVGGRFRTWGIKQERV